jgi:hypothetical protein
VQLPMLVAPGPSCGGGGGGRNQRGPTRPRPGAARIVDGVGVIDARAIGRASLMASALCRCLLAPQRFQLQGPCSFLVSLHLPLRPYSPLTPPFSSHSLSPPPFGALSLSSPSPSLSIFVSVSVSHSSPSLPLSTPAAALPQSTHPAYRQEAVDAVGAGLGPHHRLERPHRTRLERPLGPAAPVPRASPDTPPR